MKVFGSKNKLEALGFSLGKVANRIETISCFKDGDEWLFWLDSVA